MDIIYWIAAGLAGVVSAWSIIATIVEIARGKSKFFSVNVFIGILFHGGTAVLALKLANLAISYA